MITNVLRKRKRKRNTVSIQGPPTDIKSQIDFQAIVFFLMQKPTKTVGK